MIQKKTETFKINKYIDLSTYLENNERLINVTINQNDQICALIINSDVSYRTTDGSFSLIKSQKSKDFTFLNFDLEGNLFFKTRIRNELYNFHFALLLNREEILLVSARCDFNNGDPDRNARVFDLNGNFLREFVLGDGIEDIKIDSFNKIWVSYFDEGVMGNYGWNKPIGNPGLIRWDSQGNKEWEFEPTNGLDHIVDCYAFNLDWMGNIWFYYYTPFSLIKYDRQKNYVIWTCPTKGSHALAIDYKNILMSGGYDEDEFSLYDTSSENELICTKKINFQTSEGFSLGRNAVIPCYADNLGFLSENKFYYLKMNEIMSY